MTKRFVPAAYLDEVARRTHTMTGDEGVVLSRKERATVVLALRVLQVAFRKADRTIWPLVTRLPEDLRTEVPLRVAEIDDLCALLEKPV